MTTSGHGECGCRRGVALEDELSAGVELGARPLLIGLIASGTTGVAELTNAVFYAFYRGGKREPIKPSEQELAKIWIEIRDRLVRPALALRTATDRAAFVREGIRGATSTIAPPSSGSVPALGGAKVPGGYKTVSRHGTVRGLARYSTRRLDAVLQDLSARGKVAIRVDQIDTFQRIANVETGGAITALNTWDSGVVSIGFMQWTLQYGELQTWISEAAAAFARYGIAVDSASTYAFGTAHQRAIKGVTDRDDLRWNGWAERFWLAGFDEDAIIVEVRLALAALAAQLRWLEKLIGHAAYASFSPHYQASPQLRAIFHEAYNNRPAATKQAMRAVSNRLSALGTTAPTDTVLDITKEAVLAAYRARSEEPKAARLIAKTARGMNP